MRRKWVFVRLLAFVALQAWLGVTFGQQAKEAPANARVPACARQLTSGVAESRSPCWSPDGQMIVFQRGCQIWVVNADGSNQRQLTRGPRKSGFPTWSPDGKRIALSSAPSGQAGKQAHIVAMDAQGKHRVTLTSGPQADARPAWSGDGRRIAFQSNRSGNFDIWVVALGEPKAKP